MAVRQSVSTIWRTMVQETKSFNKMAEKVALTAAADGNCKAEFTVSQEMTNYAGTLHGGFTATVVDIVSTMGLMTSKHAVPGVSVNLSINYLKAAQEGEVIVVDSKAMKVGRTLAYCDIQLKKKDTGDIIAHGTHVKFVGG